MTASGSRRVILGHVSGLFGVRGWVKVHSDTEPREGILQYDDWLLGRSGQWQDVRIAESAVQGKGLIVRFEDCVDRDQAAQWVGAEIAVTRAALAPLADGFYWCDLQGLRVETIAGIELGCVDHLFSTGANDVMVVRGERERMLPWVRPDVIREVDLEAGVIKVDWDPEF